MVVNNARNDYSDNDADNNKNHNSNDNDSNDNNHNNGNNIILAASLLHCQIVKARDD